jgi:hypothetical protein
VDSDIMNSVIILFQKFAEDERLDNAADTPDEVKVLNLEFNHFLLLTQLILTKIAFLHWRCQQKQAHDERVSLYTQVFGLLWNLCQDNELATEKFSRQRSKAFRC